MKESIRYQLNMPPIRHKVAVLATLMASVVIAVASIFMGWPDWVFFAAMLVYAVCLVYFIIESIRLKSYLIIFTFLGMLGIGAYFVYIVTQV